MTVSCGPPGLCQRGELYIDTADLEFEVGEGSGVGDDEVGARDLFGVGNLSGDASAGVGGEGLGFLGGEDGAVGREGVGGADVGGGGGGRAWAARISAARAR